MCALVTGVQTCALPIFHIIFAGAALEIDHVPPRRQRQFVRGRREGFLAIFEARRDRDRARPGREGFILGVDRPDILPKVEILTRAISIAETRDPCDGCGAERSEEHTSELQSLMRNSYAVF